MQLLSTIAEVTFELFKIFGFSFMTLVLIGGIINIFKKDDYKKV